MFVKLWLNVRVCVRNFKFVPYFSNFTLVILSIGHFKINK